MDIDPGCSQNSLAVVTNIEHNFTNTLLGKSEIKYNILRLVKKVLEQTSLQIYLLHSQYSLIYSIILIV